MKKFSSQGISCWPKKLWKLVEFLRLKAKAVVRKYCILIDQVSTGGMG